MSNSRATSVPVVSTELDEVYEYVAVLEDSLVEKEFLVHSLVNQNVGLRRSIAAYKANSTRRKMDRSLASSTERNV